MSEVLIPPWIVPEKESQEWLDEGSSVFSAAFAPGLAQRQSYGGLRLKLSRRHTVRLDEKAQLLSILRSTRGRYNALRTKVHFALRGSFPSSQLLSNNTFANSTTGWSSYQSTSTLSVADRILRVRMDTVGSNGFYNTTALTTLTQYAPYALRAAISPGRTLGSQGSLRIGTTLGGGESIPVTQFTTSGLCTASGVPNDVTAAYCVFSGFNSLTGFQAGGYFECPYVSLSRCMFVDNSPNALLQSNALDNASWTKLRSSVTGNTTTGPDGSSTADSLIEDSTPSNSHFVFQNATKSAVAQDWCGAVFLKANTRTQARLLIGETGTNFASVFIDLSTGTVLSGPTSAGTVSNPRAFIADAGDGWYYCALTATIPSTITTSNSFSILLSVGGTSTYGGDGSSGIYVGPAGYAQSALPFTIGSTTTTAAASGTSQTGNAMRVKGLPASTDGLLLPGDIFEINGELKLVTAALNSDAAGLGYLQFEPALIRSPADNDPVIINEPMGKFLVSNLKIENEFGTQATVTYDLEHIYE